MANSMASKKPIHVLWSRLAVRVAGADLPQLQEKLLTDLVSILPDVQGAFSHVVSTEEGIIYLCNGEELSDYWRISCQVAIYRPGTPIPDTFPVRRLRGKTTKIPESIDETDNNIFVPFEGTNYR
jgi:hypothetical protein